MNYDPWRDAAERLPDVHIERCDIAPCRGAWVPGERVILLDRSLGQCDRRAVLAHEVAHVDLDHVPSGNRWFDRRAERDADVLAAQRMVDVDALADAIALHPLQPGLAANELGVPLRLLRRRLEHLEDWEKAYIERRVQAKGEVA